MKLLLLGLALSAVAAPAPKKGGVPPEARKHFVKAVTFQKEAKVPADFDLAIAEYREALKLKPDWQEAQYNLAVALESAGKFDEAEAELKKYIALKPKDAEKAEDKLAAMEAKKVLAQRRAAEDAVAKRKEETAAFKRKLRADYGNASYGMKLCSYLPEQRAFKVVGAFPAGCTYAEKDGTNWYNWTYSQGYIWFDEEDRINIGHNRETKDAFMRGTINGPSLYEISWEKKSNLYESQGQWLPGELELVRGLDTFIFKDLPIGRDESRYRYTQFTRN